MADMKSEVARAREFLATLPEQSTVRAALTQTLEEMNIEDNDCAPQPFLRASSTVQECRGDADLLTVAVHCLIRENGFVAVSNEPVPGATAVAGFAAPLRIQDLQTTTVLPSSWKTEPGGDGCCAFTYRCSTTGHTHTLKSLRMDGTLVLHFGTGATGTSAGREVRSTDVSSLDLKVADFVEKSGSDVTWRASDQLQAQVASMLAPPPAPTNATTSASSSPPPTTTSTHPGRASAPMLPQPVYPSGPPQPYHQDPPRAFPQMAPRPGGLFDGDIFPGGDSGNLMGPMHPAFGMEGPMHPGFGEGGGGGGIGMPTPRFDPYMPPLGPNQGGARPDHDHLRIPTFDDDPLAAAGRGRGRGRGRGGAPDNNGNGEPPPGMFF